MKIVRTDAREQLEGRFAGSERSGPLFYGEGAVVRSSFWNSATCENPAKLPSFYILSRYLSCQELPDASAVCCRCFYTELFRGNPAAVCLLSDEPPETWMQSMATEMNLAETALFFGAMDKFACVGLLRFAKSTCAAMRRWLFA